MIKLSPLVRNITEEIILKSRYLLVPLYCLLMVDVCIIGWDFMQVLFGTSTESVLIEHILQALDLLDRTMIANLIWLIAAGSFYVFVDNSYPEVSKKRPRALAHISSGLLKEKMAGSLIGVSSVHLLQVFLDVARSTNTVNWNNMGALIAIHTMFILGLLVFNLANRADHHNHEPVPSKEKDKDHDEDHNQIH